jgi:hypothetical protein
MPQEFEEQLSKVQSLCEQYNVPVKNLRRYDFVPQELEEEHRLLKELAEQDEDTHHFLEKEISRGVSLDPDRIQKFYRWDIAVERKDDHAIETYPELTDIEDENLIEIPSDADWNKDGFQFEDRFEDQYFIFARPIVSNFHLTTFLLQNNQPSLSLKMLYSHDQLGLADNTRQMHLFEHWDGPESLERIRESSNIQESSIHGGETYGDGFADKTEFLFERNDGKWNLHIEETLPRRGLMFRFGTVYRAAQIGYHTRYLHAITNEELTECYHIDGALREFPDRGTFLDRHRRSFREGHIFKDMCDRYKLFKLDSESGAIPDYQRIIGLFFKYNPYVIEFFDGPTEWSQEVEEFRKQHFRFEFDRGVPEP